MVAPIFFPLLQRAINYYLSFDPEMRARLQALTGKVLRVTIDPIELIMFVKVIDERIEVVAEYDGAIDAAIKAGVASFLQAWLQSDKAHIPKGLELTGDTQLIQTINEIFQNIDIDWEEQLSQFTGDVIAHQVGKVAGSIKSWLSETKATVEKNFTEYMQEEINVLPSRYAVEDFCEDVDKLRDDVERLVAKFEYAK